METMKAYGKVNLTLEVLGRRADGYHELRTLMQRVDLYDLVSIEPCDRAVIEADAPLPNDSAALRAVLGYMERSGSCGARVRIACQIPQEAGLGGSSADAAAILLGMQRLYGGLDEAALFSLGARVGADVPFLMQGGCALAEGIGEKLTPLPSARLELVIAKPRGGIGTGALFGALKPPYAKCTDHDRMMEAVLASDVRAIAANVGNALTGQAVSMLPAIGGYLARMRAYGALGASMTGSGSAVFGIFPTREAALEAAERFDDAAFARAVCTL